MVQFHLTVKLEQFVCPDFQSANMILRGGQE